MTPGPNAAGNAGAATVPTSSHLSTLGADVGTVWSPAFSPHTLALPVGVRVCAVLLGVAASVGCAIGWFASRPVSASTIPTTTIAATTTVEMMKGGRANGLGLISSYASL